ncbi:synaptotagmin-like protein 5 isoform X1 [Synchiropus splendidus]|uniref:synaptotagmin-like protein 5 isoform X1 n=1 Tax=Synchiropus splendidus TaxID=270530 RepID=UPI00237EB5B6|nr:synaptotagmin-like protein 5 isoform X1 [Synchiropus splendidus]XP_053733026.1 synaptotagmin-like protein 5 isoform X1 [Synchiropus splendidus]
MEDLNLSFLLEHERDTILKVLQKDEKVRKREEKRIRKLKNELLEIKRKGSRAPPQESEERLCGRCSKTLGLIFDRGDFCDQCLLRVCNDCRVTFSSRGQWKCNVCAKTLELKVLTGEWFLEERSKRFQQGVTSSDVVKQTILTTPISRSTSRPHREHLVMLLLSLFFLISLAIKPKSKETMLPFTDSERLDAHSADAARRKRRMKVDRKGLKPTLRPQNGLDCVSVKSASEGDAQSVYSVRSAPSPRSTRGGAVEASGLPTMLNNRRSQTPDRSSSSSDNRRIRPDGAESVGSCYSSDSASERRTGKNDETPTISISRASVSSDHSRSEMDLSGAGSDPSDEALSLRSRSVPGLNETEFSDEDMEEDIDALMSAHRKTVTRRLSNAVSTSSTPGSERRWSYLNVPDSDAETSSINSMMSMYSETGDYGNARVSGEILLNISYSYKTGALNVLVKECHNLATGDERKQRTDAYVKTYLLPDTSRQSKRKTSIKANSINPVFNENLRYVISHSQLETRTLQVSVWHHDRFGHNSFLGEVELTFDSWEFDSQIEEWYALQPKMESNIDSTMPYKGELTVVLKYIPAEKNLTLPLDQIQEPICVYSDSSTSLSTKKVKKGFLKGKKTSSFTLPKGGMVELLVKGAKNLTAVKSGGTSDPFVKGYLLPDSNKSTKHKTSVEKRTVNPLWNHTFTYCGLQPGDLNNVCLELTVWDKEALASNVFLGGVRLGAGTGTSYGNEVDWMDSYGEEQRVWQRMVDNPEVPHECTLMLRSSMRKHNT